MTTTMWQFDPWKRAPWSNEAPAIQKLLWLMHEQWHKEAKLLREIVGVQAHFELILTDPNGERRFYAEGADVAGQYDELIIEWDELQSQFRTTLVENGYHPDQRMPDAHPQPPRYLAPQQFVTNYGRCGGAPKCLRPPLPKWYPRLNLWVKPLWLQSPA